VRHRALCNLAIDSKLRGCDVVCLKGVLAANIPAVEGLLSSRGLIQRDIAEIQDTTIKTSESIARIQRSSQKTEEATNANRQERYHNARLFVQRVMPAAAITRTLSSN
jgi:hypothetical protein